MLIVELILVFLVVGALISIRGTFSPMGAALLLLIVCAMAVAIHLVFYGAFSLIIDMLFRGGRILNRDARRRAVGRLALKSPREKKFEAMDLERLRTYVEQHDDALACEIFCERLRERGDWKEYCRWMDCLITLPSELSMDERCRRYHDLADVYLNELDRPDRARETLEALAATFPGHYQATLARQRLAAFDGASFGPPRDTTEEKT